MFDAGKTRTMVWCDDMLTRFHMITEHRFVISVCYVVRQINGFLLRLLYYYYDNGISVFLCLFMNR